MVLKLENTNREIQPEDEVLLCVGRVDKDGEIVERLSLLLKCDLDWGYLLTRAQGHGLMPLLYSHITSSCAHKIPGPIVVQLGRYFVHNAATNLRLTWELLNILGLFELHGIRAVPYKGPTLAVSAYGNLALREFCDLDIIVPPGEVLRAKHLLVSQGYSPQFKLAPSLEAALLDSQSEYVLQSADGKVMVELQWRIAPRYFSFPLNVDPLWNRLKSVSLLGMAIPVLSAEDQLLILCVHGAKHVWDRLGWICDVARLISVHQTMDWEYVVEQARALGSERMLLLGLSLAGDLLGAELPLLAVQRIEAEPTIKALARQVQERLFSERKGKNEFLARVLFHLRCKERLGDRFRYCFGLASTSTVGDWEALPLALPRSLSFLYYPIRTIRLAGKYGFGALRG